VLDEYINNHLPVTAVMLRYVVVSLSLVYFTPLCIETHCMCCYFNLETAVIIANL